MSLRLILPFLAITAFSAQSFVSLRVNRQLGTIPRKYYSWSSIRLDADPLNRHPTVLAPCKSGGEDCQWQPVFIWIDSGYLTKSFMLISLPAFALGAASIGGLARFGVNEVWSFMLLTPLFIIGWFYSVGWFIEWSLARPRTRR
jgi:hypothetical protein